MQQKVRNDMRRILGMIIFALMLAGCTVFIIYDIHDDNTVSIKRDVSSYISGESTVENTESMFVYIQECGSYDIVYQKDTKVMYAISSGTYNNGTFTLLVNADGSPMVYEGESEE